MGSPLGPERRRDRAQRGGRAAAKTAKYPLRKIERRTKDRIGRFEIERDLLECGHLVRPASDLFGDRFPERRRCRECYEEGRK